MTSHGSPSSCAPAPRSSRTMLHAQRQPRSAAKLKQTTPHQWQWAVQAQQHHSRPNAPTSPRGRGLRAMLCDYYERQQHTRHAEVRHLIRGPALWCVRGPMTAQFRHPVACLRPRVHSRLPPHRCLCSQTRSFGPAGLCPMCRIKSEKTMKVFVE